MEDSQVSALENNLEDVHGMVPVGKQDGNRGEHLSLRPTETVEVECGDA